MDIDKLFVLKTPCSNCPFRREGAIDLREGRLQEIVHNITTDDGAPFLCHKTLDTSRSYCTGAMAYLWKVRRPNVAMRLGFVLNMLDPQMLVDCADQVIDPEPVNE